MLSCSLLVKLDLHARYFAKIVGERTDARGLLRSPLAVLQCGRHPAGAGTPCFARRAQGFASLPRLSSLPASLAARYFVVWTRHPAGAGTPCFARRARGFASLPRLSSLHASLAACFFCLISWHISCLTASLSAVTYKGTEPDIFDKSRLMWYIYNHR